MAMAKNRRQSREAGGQVCEAGRREAGEGYEKAEVRRVVEVK